MRMAASGVRGTVLMVRPTAHLACDESAVVTVARAEDAARPLGLPATASHTKARWNI
jgi:hypothetical protein